MSRSETTCRHWRPLARPREPHDYAAAERLAIEVGEDFWRMADLGWTLRGEREWVELTMDPTKRSAGSVTAMGNAAR